MRFEANFGREMKTASSAVFGLFSRNRLCDFRAFGVRAVFVRPGRAVHDREDQEDDGADAGEEEEQKPPSAPVRVMEPSDPDG